MEINSQEFTPLDKTSIPSGEIRKVKGTVMDFSSPKRILETNNSDSLKSVRNHATTQSEIKSKIKDFFN